MNNRKKSRKLLLITTVVTIIALALVLTTYAAVLLGTFQGGEVTIGGVSSSQGTITYNAANNVGGSWTTTLQQSSGSWYARLELTSTYNGPVTITWQLQIDTGSGWSDVSGATVTTSATLTGTGQDVYASATGASTGNQDWSQYATNQGTYMVTATVDSV
jgi:hypothetical protein